MTQVIDLSQAGDPRDVIHRAVHALVEGELVVVPTETAYVAGALLLQPAAVQRLLRCEEDDECPPTLAIKSAAELRDYVPDLPELAQKFSRRCWPGPVVLALDGPDEDSLLSALPPQSSQAVTRGGQVRFRVAAHDLLAEVLRLLPAPLALSDEATTGTATAATAARRWDDAAMILDDGPGRFNQPATVVRVTGDSWDVASPGVVTETMLRRLAGEVYLFICTGNTCRSPMAEALFRRMLAERLGCADDELADHGYIVLSAGISASSGSPASPEAVDLFRERGIDLRTHASQPLTDRLLDQADRIFTMTRHHREAILAARPDVADRVELLSQGGCDVSDPIGGSVRDYEECQREIERHLRSILDDLEITSDSSRMP